MKAVNQDAVFTGYAPKVKIDPKGHLSRSTEFKFHVDGIDPKAVSTMIGLLGEGVLATVDGGKGKAKFAIEGLLVGCTPKVKTDANGEQQKSTEIKVYKAAVDIENSGRMLRLLGEKVSLKIAAHQITLDFKPKGSEK